MHSFFTTDLGQVVIGLIFVAITGIFLLVVNSHKYKDWKYGRSVKKSYKGVHKKGGKK